MVKRGSIKIEILPLAKKDLAEIYEFIAKESVKYARIEKQLIIKAISRLYTFPDTGTPFNYRSINARSLPKNPAFTDGD